MITTGAINIFYMAIYGSLKDGRKTFRTNKPRLMFIRAALSQVTAFINLIALKHMQLTTFYTLVFTSPFLVALIAAYFFKDKLDKHRLLIILFGFCVILGIFHPGGKLFNGWTLLMLLSSFAYSWQLLVVRQIGSGESRAFMFMCGSAMNIMIALPFLGNHYVPLMPGEWALLMGMGFICMIGQMCIGYAFQEAPSASVVAPYHYTQIVWGALLGYYLFNEVPTVETMGGAVLLILAGLYLMHHETRKTALKPVEA